MRAVLSMLAAAALISTMGCGGRNGSMANPVSNPCEYRMAAGACHVSLVQLLQTPEAFEGRAVAVVIFYPGDGARSLFATRDAADANDLASALLIDNTQVEGDYPVKDELREAGFYRVHGTFKRSQPVVVGEGVVVPFVVGGRLSDLNGIEQLRTLTQMREHCAERPHCRMEYMGGILPMPRIGTAEKPPDALEWLREP